jgi:hypothetical protein
MNDMLIVLLLVIVILLWRSNSLSNKKLYKLIEEIETQNRTTDKSADLTNKDYIHLIFRKICDIDDSIAQIVSIATKDNPAGANFYEYVRSDNLAGIYADYLERYQNLPQNLAIKRARFEVAKFGQEAVIKEINSDFKNGVKPQRERNYFADFFASGIIDKDIESRLEKKIIPHDLFAPLYDLIEKQGYSGERDFTAELTIYTVKTYDEMVNRAAIIFRLEQLGVLLRTSGTQEFDLFRRRIS